MGTEKIFRNLNVKGTATVTKTLTASSDVTITGGLTHTAGSGFKLAVENVSSTATTGTGYGVTVLSTTKTGTRTFKIGNPATGAVKYVFNGSIPGTSSKTLVRCASTKPYFRTSTGGTRRSFNSASSGANVILVGLSTGIWQITNASTNVLYGTSFS